jgi:hypothetical protein
LKDIIDHRTSNLAPFGAGGALTPNYLLKIPKSLAEQIVHSNEVGVGMD